MNTTFIEAKLELKVTPHVTADGSILLKIKATNNQPNPQLTGANGQPSISKREAETEVLVKDGDTTVIGGIYTRAHREPLERGAVPRQDPAARLPLPDHVRAGRPHRAPHLHHAPHPEPRGRDRRRSELGDPHEDELAALSPPSRSAPRGCADNNASIEMFGICAPPDDAELRLRRGVRRVHREPAPSCSCGTPPGP